jgi:hypothetical protein
VTVRLPTRVGGWDQQHGAMRGGVGHHGYTVRSFRGSPY